MLRKSDFPLNTAVFLRSPDDNRVVWPTPSLEDDLVYIGTTDTDFAGDLDAVTADEDDITCLLNVANHIIPDARVTEDHIVGSWAGLRRRGDGADTVRPAGEAHVAVLLGRCRQPGRR